MMIDRQHGAIQLCCDVCGNVCEGERGEEFAPLWARAKNEGWRAIKQGDVWIHRCPECTKS
jgi:hypothetical protein